MCTIVSDVAPSLIDVCWLHTFTSKALSSPTVRRLTDAVRFPVYTVADPSEEHQLIVDRLRFPRCSLLSVHKAVISVGK